MDTLRMCKQCQKLLPQNAPEGLCPECLARVALGSEPALPGARVPPAPAALAPQFPQLEILELLGVGGMGMVYKARQPRLDRLVALKILPMASMPDASFGERFEREAKALAKLNHPGIVAVYDFGQTHEYYYFIMEFVDGMNLRQLIQAKALEPRQALELVTQICTALQFAHDEKIVHRDIKPENILITRKGNVKIADFGLAKLLGSQPDTALTASQMTMGTLNYMAPEQRENSKDVDHRADIYSLGVVFYEMLTGQVPMGRFDPPSKKVQVDVRLDEVVLHALEREPARRYQHVSEVQTDVESFTGTLAGTKPGNEAKLPQGDWPTVAMEACKILAIAAVVGLAMGMLLSSWPLALLFLATLTFDRTASPQERRWVKAVWVLSVIGLCGYGVWISKSAWPVVGLFLLFNWGKDEEDVAEKDARSAAKRVSPTPLCSEPALPDSSAAAITRFWLRAYGLFCLGWLAAKFLWNFRSPGCWVACFGLAALAIWISLARMRLFPEQMAIYRKIPPIKKYSSLVMNYIALTAGFIFLISAFYNYWDTGEVIHRNFSARSPEQFEKEYRGKEYHLLQRLPAFSKEIPTVEMLPVHSWTAGWFIGWGERKPGHMHSDVIPNLILGCYLMAGIPFALIGGLRVRGMRLFPFSWRHVRASLGVFAVILGSALTLFVMFELAYVTSGKFGSESKGFTCYTNLDAVTKAIETWAGTNGYVMGDNYEWWIDTVPKGNLVAKARLREAWKPSPFDRWHSTALTFSQVSPWLAFELVASENPAETYINVTGAMDCEIKQITNGSCDRIPKSLISMIEKLQK